MSIFAIGDLHLPGHAQKPMDVFGSHWDRHFDVIRENWLSMVAPEDVVLIPGDISWAMLFEEAMIDIRSIAELPGQKVLLRGNHDYWWSSVSRLRAALPKGMYALQNDAIAVDGVAVVSGDRAEFVHGVGFDSGQFVVRCCHGVNLYPKPLGFKLYFHISDDCL